MLTGRKPMSSPANPPACNATSSQVERFVTFFEALTPADIAQLGLFYDSEAQFVDPFNDVRGVPAIAAIFHHMFATLEAPRFVVRDHLEQGQQCFLTWEFQFRFKRFRRGSAQTIRGASHVVFNDAGLVAVHRDYWDAAQELYEKLPVVGMLMRWLRRRATQ